MGIESSRILLREIIPDQDDLNDYLIWLRDVEANKFIESVKSSYSLTELIDYINLKNKQPSSELFGIFLHANNKMIGTIKLEPIDLIDKSAWLGILIGDKGSRGKGFGKEAITALLNYAHASLDLNRIYLGVDPRNVSAVNLYKSIGFKLNLNQANTMFLQLPLTIHPESWINNRGV
jgi:ribosomal-protein-alanine N-acetyltransferase